MRDFNQPVLDLTGLTLYHGDCLQVLRADENGYDYALGYGTRHLIADNSVDAVVTDPPYGLSAPPDTAEVLRHWLTDGHYQHGGAGFMGADWDSFVPGPAIWRECFRVLKPGGHLLAFAGSRTHDLMGMAIRLAGFEIRDSIFWTYAQGMPKSLDITKSLTKKGDPDAQAWAGWGTNLKPAQEPITVARKPLDGTVVNNVANHGVGGLNIDSCRTQMTQADRDNINAKHAGMNADEYVRKPGSSLNLSVNPLALKPAEAHDLGRWPTNVVMSHAYDCDEDGTCVTGCPVSELDAQSGRTISRKGKPRGKTDRPDDAVFGAKTSGLSGQTGPEYNDAGGASRFFPVFRFNKKATTSERPVVVLEDGTVVKHTTVKPLELMRWLIRLVTPPGGTVLDPFGGSGTTAQAAVADGFDCLMVELEDHHVPLIASRFAA